jgi:hypothetical protein
MDALCGIPYFRKLLEDFTGVTDDTMCNVFGDKVTKHCSNSEDIILDDYLSVTMCVKFGYYIELRVKDIRISKMTYMFSVITVIELLLDLLNGKILIDEKTGIDPQVCEFLEYSGFLRGRILTSIDEPNAVFDTFEHLVLNRRPPRCMNIDSPMYISIKENIRFIDLRVPYKGMYTWLEDNKYLLIHCSYNSEILIQIDIPDANFVYSCDPRILFPPVSTKSARNG